MIKLLRNFVVVLLLAGFISSCATTPAPDPAPAPQAEPVAETPPPSPAPEPVAEPLDLDGILAGLPTKNTTDRDAYAAQVLAAGPDALNTLLDQLVAPGTGNVTSVRLALDGIAKYSTRAGGEADRALYSAAVLSALKTHTDKEVQAYLIRQLQLIGKDEAVETLAEYLGDDRLVEPAVAALLSNGSDTAAEALLDGLEGANDTQALPIIRALGELQVKSAKRKFKAFSMSPDRDLRFAALYALANLGTADAASILNSAHQRATGYDKIEAATLLRLHERRMIEDHADTGLEEGYVSLFNGQDLTGWVGDRKGYQADNGILRCMPGGNLYTKEQYGDFSLKFEFKLNPGGNNGLAVRVPMGGGSSNGMELQILDNGAAEYTELKDWQYHGSVYGIAPAKQGYLNPVGTWNQQEVIAKGRQITVILNGTTILDVNLDEATKNGPIDGKPHKNLDLAEGHLGFLGHGEIVAFRNIRVKEF